MKIAGVTMRIVLLSLDEAVTQTLDGVFFSSFVYSCLG